MGTIARLLLRVRKANEALRGLQKKLDKGAKAKVKRGRAPTVASIETQVKKILRGKSEPLKTIIHTRITEVDGQVMLEYTIDHEALDKYRDQYLGKQILFTDRDDWTTEEIVAAYRGQSYIEDAFKRMKDPHFLSWDPRYHWTDQKIEVHAFYCVMALTLTSLARRKAYQAGVDISIPEMLEQLAEIKEVVHIYPQGSKQKDCLMLRRRSELQQKLLEVLEIESLHKE